VLFDNSRPLIVYLSRRGCIEYTVAVIKQLLHLDPVLVVSQDNEQYFRSRFPDLELKLISTSSTKINLAYKTLTISRKIDKLLSSLTDRIGQIFIPAFHPWNQSIISAAAKYSIPSTYTIHDFKTHAGERSRLTERIQNTCIAISTRVNFLTQFVRGQAVSELGEQNKFKVERHPLVESFAKNELPFNPKPNLLFVGRIVSYKGIDLLLDSIKNLPINKLTIAGENQGSIIPQQENVEIIDEYLSETDLATLLEAHEILVLPYKEATQSGVLSLGIDARMVMVITKVGGLQEQLCKDAAIWVEPNADGIKKGISQLISNPKMYASIKSAVNKTRIKMSSK